MKIRITAPELVKTCPVCGGIAWWDRPASTLEYNGSSLSDEPFRGIAWWDRPASTLGGPGQEVCAQCHPAPTSTRVSNSTHIADKTTNGTIVPLVGFMVTLANIK